MTKRTADLPGPTEFEIETRGMALAADLLDSKGEYAASRLILREVLERQRAFRAALEAKA